MKFFIISPAYKCEKWLGVHLMSVMAQKASGFHHIVINSHSSKDIDTIIKKVDSKNTTVLNCKNSKTLGSHIVAMDYAFDKLGMSNEDVVVHLDADDWFCHPNVLDCLEDAYAKGALATYGNYIATDGTASLCRKVTNKFDRKKDVFSWYFSHLRTFKAFFWKKIKQEDFYFGQKLFPSAADVAICAPVLEMCPLEKLKFIDVANVIYNRFTILNDDKVDPYTQFLCTIELSKREPYKEL